MFVLIGELINSDEPMDFSKPIFDKAISRRGFADNNSSGIENNHERKVNQINDGVDSCNSLASSNLSDKQKVTLSEDQFLLGRENQWEVGVLSKDEIKNVSRLADVKIHGDDIHFGDTGASTQKVDTIGRNHGIVERAHALMTSPKTLDQQGPIDGPTRMSVVSASEKYSGLNTSVKTARWFIQCCRVK